MLRRQLGDDEATESFVIGIGGDGRSAVRFCSEELQVGFRKVPVGEAFVLIVSVLPILMPFGIIEFLFCLCRGFAKGHVQFALMGRNRFGVFVQRIVADDRLPITVSGIKLAVTC